MVAQSNRYETTAGERRKAKSLLAPQSSMNKRSGRDLFGEGNENTTNPTHAKKRRTSGDQHQRFMKPDPYPSDVPESQKWSRWIDWRQQFKVALSLHGETSQLKKANLLFMSGGPIIREIVSSQAMMPDPDAVAEDFAHYEHLMERLNDYFRKISDVAVDLGVFSSMKQESKENAREFHLRLLKQAMVCGLSDAEDLIRNQFIRGMRNRDIADRAFIDNWKLNDLVQAVARKEALSQSRDILAPWNESNKDSPIEVAAISSQRSNNRPGRGIQTDNAEDS